MESPSLDSLTSMCNGKTINLAVQAFDLSTLGALPSLLPVTTPFATLLMVPSIKQTDAQLSATNGDVSTSIRPGFQHEG